MFNVLQLTIRARLSLLFAFSTVMILVALSVFIYLFTWKFRQNEFRHRLKVRLTEADSLLRRNSDYPFMTLEHLPPGTLPQEQFYFRRPAPLVTIPENNQLITLASLQAVEKEGFYYTDRGQRSYLIFFDKQLGHVVVLSAVDEFGFSKLQNLRKVLLAGVLLGSIAMGFISWYLPRRELRPLSDKIRKARRIGGESLNLRLDVRNEYDELGELAITFNQMLDRIEKAFDVQKRFTSNAAHELRNPITAISGEAQLALMQPRNAGEYKATLERIKNKSDDLQKLVEHLLILARIESSQSEKRPVHLHEVLLDTVASAQSRNQELARAIRIQIQEGDSAAFTLSGDAVMLQVAFANVMENALKYGEGRPVSVELSATTGGIQVVISDNGMGIPQAEADRLFQLFYRTNDVRHIQGTGVGLALVKSIVEWHNGEIVLEANKPTGTRVVISLPGL